MPGSLTTPDRPGLALAPSLVWPSALVTASASGTMGLSRLDGWPARSPADASPLASRPDARLGADVDRYSFVVSDFHRLLLAGLPAHYQIPLTETCHMEGAPQQYAKERWVHPQWVLVTGTYYK